MRTIFQTSHFKRDIRKLGKRGKDLQKLVRVINTLAKGDALARSHKDHALTGKWSGSRDCHIEPDWLLLYRIEGDNLYLERSGSHSDLFK